MPQRRVAKRDPRLVARVGDRRQLFFEGGADASIDRPAHVRAASAARFVGEQLVIVQDDASFVVLADPSRPAAAIGVPFDEGHRGARQFDDARGNKGFKLDLEAAVVIERRDGPLLLAFGSGSSPRRESVVVARASARADARRIECPALYAALRGCEAFAGSELNVEGAIAVDDRVRLFQRGNGAARGDLLPVDATCELSIDALLAHLEAPETRAPPPLRSIEPWDLGAIDGVRLGFTDAAIAGGRVFFLAAAEASPDAVRDGPVAGVALGVVDAEGGRWAELIHEGRRFDGKAEGLAFDPHDARAGWLVVDRDDPELPAELWRFELDGPW